MTEHNLKTFHLEMTLADGRTTTTNYAGNVTVQQLRKEQVVATTFEFVMKTTIYSLSGQDAERLVLSEWDREEFEKWMASISEAAGLSPIGPTKDDLINTSKYNPAGPDRFA